MLITFEGIDGSGKSTQAQLLVSRLQVEGRQAELVREPGGTVLSERIRMLLLDASLEIHPFTELLLFSAARSQLFTERLLPALQRGTIIVCDRFYDSTIAYQGGGRSLPDSSWLRDFQRRVVGGLIPDRTYLICLDPLEARSRTRLRADEGSHLEEDRMEAAGLEFQRAVSGAYAQMAAREPERILCLDGRSEANEIHRKIWEDLQKRLPSD